MTRADHTPNAPRKAGNVSADSPQWETSEWETFRCIVPRFIDGQWFWLTKAQRRTVYVGGALGLLCESWRTEYRSAA